MLTAKSAQIGLESLPKSSQNFGGTGAWTKAELEGESRWNRSQNVSKIHPKPDVKPVSEPETKL